MNDEREFLIEKRNQYLMGILMIALYLENDLDMKDSNALNNLDKLEDIKYALHPKELKIFSKLMSTYKGALCAYMEEENDEIEELHRDAITSLIMTQIEIENDDEFRLKVNLAYKKVINHISTLDKS